MAGRGSKQVGVRWALLTLAFAYVAIAAVLVFSVSSPSSESSVSYGSSDGAYTSSLTTTTDVTLWESQGAPVAVILGLLVVVLLVGAASLAWRVRHGSSKAGRSALVAAALLGLVSLAGLLSIGILLVPLVALMVVVALPLETTGSEPIAEQ